MEQRFFLTIIINNTSRIVDRMMLQDKFLSWPQGYGPKLQSSSEPQKLLLTTIPKLSWKILSLFHRYFTHKSKKYATF
jgi:hypothetical protein